MQRLPEEQREVVALILIDGFGYREAAEILEQPIGTVSSRLAQGPAGIAHHAWRRWMKWLTMKSFLPGSMASWIDEAAARVAARKWLLVPS